MICRLALGRKLIAGRTVLGALDLALGAGEIVALLGPSGCGKTTLLRILAGRDRSFEGTLRWAEPPPRIAPVFQEPRLLPWRTVRQNLTLIRPDAAPRADLLLERLGLAAFADGWASHLSLGMARRLALARALLVEPQLLLLDEAFVSLDEAAAEQGRSLVLEEWRRRGMAVLLVTHDLREAACLADRVHLLTAAPGRIAATVEVPAARRRAGAEAVAATVNALRQSIAGK